jgi:streptomycin 6-kinase
MDQPIFPERWAVSDPVLIAETFSSRIWKVRLGDGGPAIVKDLKSFGDEEDELRGAHFLEWRRGKGAVRLYETDGNRMLLEYAGERLLIDDLKQLGDAAATEVAAEVTAELLSPSDLPAPPDLQPLAERFASLFKKAKADRTAGSAGLYVEAAELAGRLLGDQRDVRPLHGDLHHENIMHGARGWLAFDPKGLIGDPCFDVANYFYNPLGHETLCRDPERIDRLAEAFAKALGRDPRTVLDYAVAWGCLSCSWHHHDGNEKDEMSGLSMVEAIRAVRFSF